jgi:hypothetical protein
MTLPASGPLAFTDIQTEFGGSNPIGLNEYYAGGANVPAGTSGTYGAVPSSGQISVQNFYGTSDFIPVYVQNVFAISLYTGNNAVRTITNNIDISGNGGLVWIKNRTTDSTYGGSHQMVDTARGLTGAGGGMLSSNNNDLSSGSNGYNASEQGFQSFNSDGFNLKSVAGEVYSGSTNTSGVSYVAWTFREAPKFFDIVRYTGNGAAGRQISHNLGSAPGCIIVKNLTIANNWVVYHTASGPNRETALNTAGDATNNAAFGADPTSTVFTVNGSIGSATNGSGSSYVAYLFANNAGGFGATGTDNVITCGEFTTDEVGSADATVGYEPQWVMWKAFSPSGQDWKIYDTTRGWSSATSGDRLLVPNLNAIETTNVDDYGNPTSTGFTVRNQGGSRRFLFITIRKPQ